jgi:hypothetical protein
MIMVNIWETPPNNSLGNAPREGVTNVTVIPEWRRDAGGSGCRDSVKKPITTAIFESAQSELNRRFDIAGSLILNAFQASSRRPPPQFWVTNGDVPDRLSGWVTPANALDRRYRMCPKSPILDPDNTSLVTILVMPTGALPVVCRPGVFHTFFLKVFETDRRFNEAATGQTWRIA